MYSHPERIRQGLTAAPGVAGDLALGPARVGYAALGAAHDGKTFVVTLLAGVDWEVRRDCVYTHATATLTRGTLVVSSTGSAVDLPITTIMRVGPSGYEADRLLPADLDGSGNALRVVDGNGNRFALLPLDANDNVIANIAHRQNTLANLLALDGLAGEISVATDDTALVLHNGVAGQARQVDDSFVRVGPTSYRGGATSDTLAGPIGAGSMDVQASRSAADRYASGAYSLAFGLDIRVASDYSVAVGSGVDMPAGVLPSIAIGNAITLPDGNGRRVVVGIAPTIGTDIANAVVIGTQTNIANSALSAVGVGYLASVIGEYGVAVGVNSVAPAYGVAIGKSANAGTYSGGIAIGNAATLAGATGDGGLAIGMGAPTGAYCGVIAVGPNSYGSSSSNALTIAATALTGALSCNLRCDAVKGEVTLGGKGTKIRVPSTADISTYGIALTSNQYMQFELVSNTQLKINLRGTDGVIRSTTLTLA